MHGKTWLTIPTYWGYESGVSGEEQTVFDHPTPLDSLGTLPRLLESIQKLGDRFSVLIILGVVHPRLAEAAHMKLASILKPFTSEMDILLISPINVNHMNELFSDLFFSLDSYGSIRNVQIALPYLMGCDSVIGIDDDEMITDKNYVKKALEFLGGSFRGDFVGGVAGPYLDGNGGYKIAGADRLASKRNIFEKKNYYMNEALIKVMADSKMKPSNVAFGGNMCFARKTIGQVCFDPYIPRGEDYDYVMNAKMQGINFYFRPDMPIVHLPPDSMGAQAGDNIRKLAADVKRFLYVKEKYNYHCKNYPQEAFDVESVMPYPGVYLNKSIDLIDEGKKALLEVYPGIYRSEDAGNFIQEAYVAAKKKVAEYFSFREKWKRFMLVSPKVEPSLFRL